MRDPSLVLSSALDAFTEKLDAYDGDATDDFCLPKRRYVQVGDVPPEDCPQLTIRSAGVYQGNPGQPSPGYQVPTGGLALYAMDVGVTLVRSVPGADNAGRPPSAESLTHASLTAGRDAKVLTDIFFASVADNSLAGACDVVWYGGCSWSGPQGRLLATELIYAIQL